MTTPISVTVLTESFVAACEGGTEGLYCYTVAKNLSHKMTAP
jgi:hypothetical protein